MGIAGAGISVAVLPIALVTHWVAAAASLFVRSTMDFIRMSANLQLVQESVTPRWRPVATGAYNMCNGAIMFAIAFAGGLVFTRIDGHDFGMMVGEVRSKDGREPKEIKRGVQKGGGRPSAEQWQARSGDRG